MRRLVAALELKRWKVEAGTTLFRSVIGFMNGTLLGNAVRRDMVAVKRNVCPCRCLCRKKGVKPCSEKVGAVDAFSQLRVKYLDLSWRGEFKSDCAKVYRGALHIKEFAIRQPFLYLER